MNEQQIRSFCALAAFFVGAFISWGITRSYAHNNAIQQSCAYYDMKTGEFKWGQPQ